MTKISFYIKINFYILIIIGFLLCTILAGCGGNNGGETLTPPPPLPPPPQAAILKAGAAKIDITPPRGQRITMSGYSSRNEPFIDIHDDLFVRAVVVYDGQDYAVYVSADQLRVNASDFKYIVDSLAAEGINIPVENYFIAATHTHGAPSTSDNPNPDTAAYQEDRLNKTIDVIRSAYNNLTDVTIQVSKADIPDFSNNRQELITNMSGETECDLGRNVDGISDKEINIAEFRDSSGNSVASIVLAGVHSTVMGEHNSYITGDFAGAAARHIENLRAGDHISLWIMSGGGDQSPTYFHQKTSAFQDPVKSPEAQTRQFSETILASLSSVPVLTEIDIKSDFELVDFPLKNGGSQERAIYAISWNKDIVFLATPFELFSETTINLKETSPFKHSFVQSKTNGSAFYLPTERSAGFGCYENRVALFPASAEPIFVETSQHLLQTLYSNY